MNVTEQRINLWAKAISETEEEKCQNAISQITEAIRGHFGNSVILFQQGSHTNRTNIRADSDVDIAIVHKDYYFSEIHNLSESDKKLHQVCLVPASYEFTTFKADIYNVLKNKFGLLSTERKNKCIRIKENSNRVNADVVPAYVHKRYRSFGNIEVEGIEFITDSKIYVQSFPEQHYKNGVKKNDNTGQAYKAVVRVLKNVRNEMVEKNLYPKDVMSSFFIECLVWNVPDSYFRNSTYRHDARAVALQIWDDMRKPEKANLYAEVSDLRWLFRGHSRTPAQAESFMLAVWSYLEE